ncbi:MAG: hypothetical protein KDD70_04670 [Bdellovibrionales bacterium]|nr:hypothetical protein [Bdellovibrionales bacterium]
MDAGSIKTRLSLQASQQQSAGTASARSASPSKARDALLSVQAELGAALRTAKILAQEKPPMSEDEAFETAERIAGLLRASNDAFGQEGALFQDLSPDRARALLM